ncbi:MAG: NADPH-dependent F420 reductase [Anaerolineae bacterium]
MQVTIIGTGRMARGIATRFRAGGHNVLVMGRDSVKASALAAEIHGQAAPYAPESVAGEVVVLALPFSAVFDVAKQFAPALAGKVVVDITNQFNATRDGAALPNSTSAAEEIQKILGDKAAVIKAFNTVFASTLLSGKINGEPVEIFVAGDDASAKAKVIQLVRDGGLLARDVGPLTRARLLEPMAILDVAIQPLYGNGYNTGWKLVIPSS